MPRSPDRTREKGALRLVPPPCDMPQATQPANDAPPAPSLPPGPAGETILSFARLLALAAFRAHNPPPAANDAADHAISDPASQESETRR